MRKSDAAIYALAVLLGICAGLIESRLGEILLTTLFELVVTMCLGFVRPRHAWRWIVIVGVCVPLVELAAYIFLKRHLYSAQVWEAGLGFVTGIVGCYSGVLARKGVDELVRPGKVK